MIALFEDEKWKKLYPLSLSHPVWDLRVGIFTIREKYEHYLSEKISCLNTRKYLEKVVKENFTDYIINDCSNDVILANSRVLPDKELINTILSLEKGEALTFNGEIVACRTKTPARYFDENGIFTGCPEAHKKEISGVRMFTYLYQLVHFNSQELKNDFNFIDKGIVGEVMEGAHLIEKDSIIVAKGAKVYPGVVIDASEGPVFIDENAVIMPNATIIGPVYIGKKTKIKVGAKIYEGTSIGPVCKVGGEVEESIIHSYSNKQHDGFLGHAYLGQWVNIGADTNNSDLKNNYSHVKIFIDGEWIDTGEMFVGLTMGDHSKSGINTMFNTGTVVGFSSNIYGGDFPPKFVPSFAWGGPGGFTTYKFEKAVETARRVMGRRDVELTDAYQEMMKIIFNLTKEERKFE